MIAPSELMVPTPGALPDLQDETENPTEILAVSVPVKAEPPLVLVVEDEETIGHPGSKRP